MSTIYEVKQADFRFSQLGGYNLPLVKSITAMRKALRGNCSHDSFAVIHYRENGDVQPLMKGYLNTATHLTMGDYRFINEQIRILTELLDENSSDARWSGCCLPADHLTIEHDHMAGLFVKCNDGVIGAAWLDYEGSSKKALRMCAFICYMMGVINVDLDRTLWESTTRYLPDDSNLISDVDKTDGIIEDTIREEACLTGKVVITRLEDDA